MDMVVNSQFISSTKPLDRLKLSNLSMGLANISDMDSFSGIWNWIHPTRTIQNKLSEFTLFVERSGYTKSVLFSFNGQDQNPSIIFGGISTNIIDGPLVRAPLLK